MFILILFFSLTFNDSISIRLNVVKVFIEYNVFRVILFMCFSGIQEGLLWIGIHLWKEVKIYQYLL